MKPGETLHDIAQSEAIRIESLMEYNYLDPGRQPIPGEVLQLHKKADQPARNTKK
ncbi:MAG: LysM peptidoglycan-binding domain-containing protein [Bacteroidia bacterium]|nr:LysM peptidoglycan-binding domain-containing protein [Bacteroidia bacterium]